jgi:ribonuclease Z
VKLLILGSNSAAFAYGRHHTAQVLENHNKLFLIDCGEGTQIRIKKYKVKLARIHCVFISHLHGDHYLGLTGLLNTMHLYGREAPFKVIGPPGLREILTLQFRHSQTTLTYPIEFTEWLPNEQQLVYEDQKLTVHTIPLEHKVICSGYLFKEKPKPLRLNRLTLPKGLSTSEILRLKKGQDILNIDGSIKYLNSELTLPPLPSLSYAFCSDTRYMPHLGEIVRNVDLLYHESSFLEEMADRAAQTKHSTAKQAAQAAKDANAKALLVGHFSSRYKHLDAFLEEAREIYPGAELAIEGKTFEIK